MSCHRVEHQNGSGPPSVFLRTSASTGIVHRLSGPITTTRRSPTANVNHHISLAVAMVSLVRVSIRVRTPRLKPMYFHFSPPKGSFFRFPSQYLYAIGLPPVFSLGCFYHPFALHYQAALLVPRAPSGAITRCGPAFNRVSHVAPQRPKAFHWGSSLFTRCY